MDSINAEQPEENREDLHGQEAVDRIRDVLEKTKSCFFCTAVALGESGGTRPMSVQQLDDDGVMWFLSAADSRKNAELQHNPAVRLLFQGSEHAGFLTLTGMAEVTRTRKKIKELWSPVLKTWFTGGADDPRITAIAFMPIGGYYWDNKHGTAVAGIKMLLGAALGKTLDDSIEGTLALKA